MINRAELKSLSRSQLSGKWGTCILVTIITLAISAIFKFTSGDNESIIVEMIKFVALAYVEICTYNLYLKITRGQDYKKLGDILLDLKVSGKYVIIAGIVKVVMLLVTMILIKVSGIPMELALNYANLETTSLNPEAVRLMLSLTKIMGAVGIINAIVALYVAQVQYVSIDDEKEGFNVIDIIARSARLMKGHKFELAILMLSFTGWYLLGVITAGIALLWVVPYTTLTLANYYEMLVQEEQINI
ncbi:MAG: DUF975 family protein [Clostridium sp.]